MERMGVMRAGFLLLWLGLTVTGCEVVPEAQAQGKCPDARLLADGRCCPTGQRVKEDGIGATCEADPNAKKKASGGAKKGSSAPQECEEGKERSEDTEGRCCWPGQAWNGKRCVGAPTRCPSGWEAKGDSCELPECEEGKVRKGKQVACCYPGQAYSSSREQCLGEPTKCPGELKASGDSCECAAGLKQRGTSCECPDNAMSKSGDACSCPAPMTLQGDVCVCPGKKVRSGASCACPETYVERDGICVCARGELETAQGCLAQGKVVGGYALIKSGTFTMGSSSRHSYGSAAPKETTISRNFYIKKTEVTQAEWAAVMGRNFSEFKDCGPSCPVENISWEDSLEYLNKLSDINNLERCYSNEGGRWRWPRGLDCKGYRLPTEAEWEYAARGGTTGERYGSVDSIAWYDGNSGGKTQPVGMKTANTYGLYDMLGNVYEWTWDAHYDQHAGGKDPIRGGLAQQDTRAARVGRGCSWNSDARNCRAADRSGNPPSFRLGYFGLRPARSDR